MLSRRLLLAGGAGLAVFGLGGAMLAGGPGLRAIEEGLAGAGLGSAPPRVLIRSVWQHENIGDIAHGLGSAALVRAALPDAVITLWTGRLNEASRACLERGLPGVDILEMGTSAVRERIALATSSFLFSSSSAGLAARGAIGKWLAYGERPYGLFGLTWAGDDAQDIALMRQARFAFFRDSESVRLARAAGVRGAEWVADDAFACPLGSLGSASLAPDGHAVPQGWGLGGRPYVCCVPRYRFTPVWTMAGRAPVDPARAAFNAAHVEPDHAFLRQAMIAAVREHGAGLLICPEETNQIALGRLALLDPLPSDVKAAARVVERFWMPDAAMAAFAGAAAVLSADQHSPILALAAGVPAILCRSREQTSKGLMWQDIGLGEWLFDFDNAARMRALPAVLGAILGDQAAARAKAAAALARARRVQAQRMREVAALVRGGSVRVR